MRDFASSTRNVASAALVAALLCALSCGGGNPAMPNTYAYIAVYGQTGASSIAQFQLTNSGTLGPLNPAIVPAGVSVSGLSVVPGTNYLYALDNATNSNISTFLRFSIKSGGLEPNPIGSPGPVETPYPFALTPDGRFLLVPFPGLTSYRIGADGAVTLVSSVPAGMDPCIVAIDPTGTFAYVADNTGLAIYEYRIAADGTLTPIGNISTGPQNQPYFLGFSPEGFLYSAGCCRLGGVSEYSIDSSTGALAHLNDFTTVSDGTGEAVSIAFDPAGKYAYVTNSDSVLSGYTISSFTVNKSTGALTRNGPDTPAVGTLQVVVDPSGRFVFALSKEFSGFSQNVVYQFKISSSGTLVPNGIVSLPGNLPYETAGSIVFEQP
jgi:6-phosphogluconolactonase (cycloisomerase 2 family)